MVQHCSRTDRVSILDMYLLIWLEHVVFAVFLVIVGQEWYHYGLVGVADVLIKILKKLPGFEDLIHRFLRGEVQNFTNQVCQVRSENNRESKTPKVKLPSKGKLII